MQYTLQLKAGQPQRHSVGGNLVLLVSAGSATDLTLTVERNSSPTNVFTNITRGFKFRAPQGFTSLLFSASVDTQIEFIETAGDVETNLIDGATVNVGTLPPVTVGNGPGNPVPVVIENQPASPVPVVVENAVIPVQEQAWPVPVKAGVVIVNEGPFAVGPVATKLLDVTPGMKAVRFRNVGKEIVGIGGGGVSAANAVIVLPPGGVREETDVLQAAFYGVSDNAQGIGQSLINVEVVTV